MKTINKIERYQSPLCYQVDLIQEGFLCSSTVSEGSHSATLDSFNQNTESYW